MPTDQDRNTLYDIASRNPLSRRASGSLDEQEAELRALLTGHVGEQAPRYVPLPRIIQE